MTDTIDSHVAYEIGCKARGAWCTALCLVLLAF